MNTPNDDSYLLIEQGHVEAGQSTYLGCRYVEDKYEMPYCFEKGDAIYRRSSST